jgi:spore coat polysaccharide biosynthesis protein SpsF
VRTLVVVQARSGSSRLPGKVLKEVVGTPLLAHMLQRVRAAYTPFDLVVATTEDSADDAIVDLCRALGVRSFRGHPTDLLDRHYRAALAAGAEAVVKIPSDCPLIDPGVVDRVIAAYVAETLCFDYVSNLHPATWPDGNDVEVLAIPVLEQAWREATRPHEREHTTPFVWDRPSRFRIGNVRWETRRDLSMTHRFTLDYPEDLAFVTAVYEALWRRDRPVFGLAEILALLDARPEIAALNRRHLGVNWYRHHLSELRTVSASETRSSGACA